jgi:hypothetical protein
LHKLQKHSAVYVLSKHCASLYSSVIPSQYKGKTKESIMRIAIQTTRISRHTAAEQSYQDYLRISQNARTAAMAARRAASAAFWAAVADAIRSIGRHARVRFSQHASVRLGAGHHVQRLEG